MRRHPKLSVPTSRLAVIGLWVLFVIILSILALLLFKHFKKSLPLRYPKELTFGFQSNSPCQSGQENTKCGVRTTTLPVVQYLLQASTGIRMPKLLSLQSTPPSQSGQENTKCGVRTTTFPVVQYLLQASTGIRKPNLLSLQSCHPVKQGMLNVHLVPHTHDDVGWLKTVDQYYYGTKKHFKRSLVRNILNSVVRELHNNPDRRFIYVETAFLWKWWQEQNETNRQRMRDLVISGRLEIVGGAWSMNDEAAVHYQSVVDQFSWGFRKLGEMFGKCGNPRVGWQIDPFGHSREMASLFSQLGFDGVFLGRLDYQDRSNRLQRKTSEMIWAGSPNNLGESANLFTTVLFNHYSPPSGFCFDVLCNDEPIIDNIRRYDFNVNRKVDNFIDFCNSQAKAYNNDNIIITMGDDFHYEYATKNFENMDKLIKYVNRRQAIGSLVNMFYSTPSCYLKAVINANLTWTVKEDDFFPYACDPYTYWTGYFTSRPTSKYFERQGNNYLQVAKQLTALARLDESTLDDLREAMGIMQHHDAITGTARQHVAQDYCRIMYTAFQQAKIGIENSLNRLMDPSNAVKPFLSVDSCLLSNVSDCIVTASSSSFAVTVYNPISHPVTHFVRLPVLEGTYSVKDRFGVEQVVQVVPIPPSVLALPERSSQATKELVFQAKDLPPVGFRVYYITRVRDERNYKMGRPTLNVSSIGNEMIQVNLDSETGLVREVVYNGVNIPVKQEYLYYESSNGVNTLSNQASGAYIFRPAHSDPTPNAANSKVTNTVYKGELVEEIHQTFSEWVSQVVRVYKGENHVEFEWLVGPIPVENGIGKEVISRFSSNLSSNGIFYTDSNGRELLKRQRNCRPTYNVDIIEPISGNYYPVTSKILLQDASKNLEMAVLNDRAQGGSSIHDGELELMVHRRLLHDDGRGVSEALNEVAFGQGLMVRGKHWLVVGALSSLAAEERLLAQQKLLSPWTFLIPTEGISFNEFNNTFRMEYSGLQQALPPNVQILTLESWKDDTVLLRLEHILEKGEDKNLSKPVTVDLQNLFESLSIVDIKETILGANQLVSEMSRIIWKPKTQTKEKQSPPPQDEGTKVTLSPMQIRTFVLTLAPSSA